MNEQCDRTEDLISLLSRARQYVIGPHYVDEYGNELEPQFDTSPVLLAEIDAVLGIVHASDCPINNAPALPVGTCECGATL